MPTEPAGFNIEQFNKAVELRNKAAELMLQKPQDAETLKEIRKLNAEANELMLKAVGGGGGAGGLGAGGLGLGMPAFPDVARGLPERPRLGVRLEHVSALAADQLGLDANTGIAVALVTPGSAAEKAGLKVHDIILEFAGKAVTDNTEDFIRRVNEVKDRRED